MSHGWVRRIELDENNNLNLQFAVDGSYANTPIEISGEATQANGIVATFHEVQVPTGTGNVVPVTVGPIPTVGNFVPSNPITVVARAAYVWVTSLQKGPSSPASIAANWQPPASTTPFKAEWTWTNEAQALCAPAQAAAQASQSGEWSA